jgi:hypothetical protein
MYKVTLPPNIPVAKYELVVARDIPKYNLQEASGPTQTGNFE